VPVYPKRSREGERMTKILTVGTVISLFFAGAWLLMGDFEGHSETVSVSGRTVSGGRSVSILTEAKLEEMREFVLDYWTECGMTDKLAEGLYLVQELDLAQWYLLDREAFEKHLRQSLFLVNDPVLMGELEDSPELVNLVLRVLEHSEECARDLVSICQSNPEAVKELYLFFSDTEEAIRLTEILKRPEFCERILKLYERSPGNLDFVQLFELADEVWKEDPKRAEIYQWWLFRLVDRYLEMDSESFHSHEPFMMLNFFSKPILEGLQREPALRAGFKEYWIVLERVIGKMAEERIALAEKEAEKSKAGETSKEGDEMQKRDQVYLNVLLDFVSDENLWTFLPLFSPEKVEKIYLRVGNGGSFLLTHRAFLKEGEPEDPKTRNARERLANLLIAADEEQLYSIFQIREEAYPDLAAFLNRALDDENVRKGVIYLGNLGWAAHEEVMYWSRLSDAVLLKEEPFRLEEVVSAVDFIPGGDISRLVEKMMDGRRVQGEDWVCAGIDTAFLIPDLVSGVVTVSTGGAAAPLAGGVAAAKAGVKGAAKVGAKVAVKRGVKIGMRNLTRKTQKELMKHGGKKALSLRSGMDILWNARAEMHKLLKVNANITDCVRLAFKNSKLGCNSFKNMTGLDARIFMRGDRRVVMQVDIARGVERVAGDGAASFVISKGIEAASSLVKHAKDQKEMVKRLREIHQTYQTLRAGLSEETLWKSELSSWWGMCP